MAPPEADRDVLLREVTELRARLTEMEQANAALREERDALSVAHGQKFDIALGAAKLRAAAADLANAIPSSRRLQEALAFLGAGRPAATEPTGPSDVEETVADPAAAVASALAAIRGLRCRLRACEAFVARLVHTFGHDAGAAAPTTPSPSGLSCEASSAHWLTWSGTWEPLQTVDGVAKVGRVKSAGVCYVPDVLLANCGDGDGDDGCEIAGPVPNDEFDKPAYSESSGTAVEQGALRSVSNETVGLHYPMVAWRCANLDDLYEIYSGEDGVLGDGTFSTVRLGICRSTGVKYAVKTVILANLQPPTLVRLRREIRVLRSLGHRNVVRLHDAFEETVNGCGVLHIVTELCSGGTLWQFLQRVEVVPDGGMFYCGPRGPVELTESKVARLVRGAVEAVAHCHSKRVCHRDLKLENLMLSSSRDDAELKLIDFGFCKTFNGSDSMYTVLGSPYYVAPEVLKAKAPARGCRGSGYGPAADMWSLGVIAYMLLCGRPPFDGETDQARLAAVRRGVVAYPANASLSREAVSFIDGLLTVDPCRRLDARAALQHPWLRST